MKRWSVIAVTVAALMSLLIWRLDHVRALTGSKAGGRHGTKDAASSLSAAGVTAPLPGGVTPAVRGADEEGSGAAAPKLAISVRRTSNVVNVAGVSETAATTATMASIQAAQPPSQVQRLLHPPSTASLPRQNPGAGPSPAYFGKLSEIAALGQKLSQRQIDDLYAYLNLRFDAQHDMGLVEFDAVKNNILDKLLGQNKVPQGFGARLAVWSRDPNQDDLFRAYCVQHFVFYWEQRWPSSGSAAGDPEAANLLRAYWDATQETGNPIAGTALAGLARISAQDAGVDRSRVASKVLATALDDSCGECSRIAAVQLCGEMGLNGVVPGARRLAENSASIPLRLAAIATLGQVGGASEQSFLTGLAASPGNAFLGRAVEVALLRLRDGNGAKTKVKR